MTEIQKQALRLMDEQNVGCLLVKGFGWVWPTNLRNDGGRFGEERAIEAAHGVVRQLEPANTTRDSKPYLSDALDRCFAIMGL
jgi:hypothetical protein